MRNVRIFGSEIKLSARMKNKTISANLLDRIENVHVSTIPFSISSDMFDSWKTETMDFALSDNLPKQQEQK